MTDTKEKKPKKKMSPNSLAALEPTKFNNLSPERRREIARMGAEATNKKIKKRKSFCEIIEALGTSEATEDEKRKFLQMFPGADPDEITKDMMIIASMYNQGIGRGNVKAASMLRDTVGEKPDTTINGTITAQKIFVSPEEQQAALQHIAKVIADDNTDNGN